MGYFQRRSIIKSGLIKFNKVFEHLIHQSKVGYRMKRQRYEEEYVKEQKQQLRITLQWMTEITKELLQCIQQNTNLRMKYAQQPQKFYPAQQEIHTLLQTLSQQLSQQHIPIIISSHLTNPFIKLLTHPNLDLSLEVIQILYQLLQQQPQSDQLYEIYYRWVRYMLDNSCAEAIVGVLTKIDQENSIEEYEVGLKCIRLLQVFINVTDDVFDLLAQDRQLLEYLANRIMPNFLVKHKVIDDNKYATSDILVSLLSNSQKSQHLFSQFSGIQVLLETISSYQTNLPTNQDEKQFLNNLFSSLSILLMNFLLPQNKKTYHEMKGNYLMISFLKMKNQYSPMALKCIANSLIGLAKHDEQSVVKGIIDGHGLKYLFAVFRRIGVRGEDVDEQKAIDQNCLAIFYSMLRTVTEVYKDRLQYKLIENRFENLERFFELRAEYMQAVEAVQQTDAKEQKQISTSNKQQDTTKNNTTYITKLSEGLSIVQIIDKTLLVLVDKYSKLKSKLINLLKIYGLSFKQIQKTINDHYQYIGIKEEKAFVQLLLAKNLILMKKLFQKIDQDRKNDKGEIRENGIIKGELINQF